MQKTTKIQFAIGDARRRIDERTAEAANKYKYNRKPKIDSNTETLPSQQEAAIQEALELYDRFARGQQEARRQLNERATRALAEYTRCFNAARADIIPVELDDFHDAHSVHSDTERYYLGSLKEDTKHETVSEMQSSWFDARESLSAQPDTKTIHTQTDLSFLSY